MRPKKTSRTLADQYSMPSEKDVTGVWRLLGMGETIQDGDKIWNFHFKHWCYFNAIDRLSMSQQIEYNHPHSPRLCVIRRRLTTEELNVGSMI